MALMLPPLAKSSPPSKTSPLGKSQPTQQSSPRTVHKPRTEVRPQQLQVRLEDMVALHPPLAMVDILEAHDGARARMPDPQKQHRRWSERLDETPTSEYLHAHAHLLTDPDQQRAYLWGGFQQEMAQRRAGGPRSGAAAVPSPPPYRSPGATSPRVAGAKAGRSPRMPPPADSSPPSEEPADWPSRVAYALHRLMKRSRQRVRTVFERFDTDESGYVDAHEFEAALRELHLPQALALPEEEVGPSCRAVFDAFDVNGTGLLDFEFCGLDWRAIELAVCLSKYVGEDDPFPLVESFIDGFCESGSLTDEEIDGVPDMINMRLRIKHDHEGRTTWRSRRRRRAERE